MNTHHFSAQAVSARKPFYVAMQAALLGLGLLGGAAVHAQTQTQQAANTEAEVKSLKETVVTASPIDEQDQTGTTTSVTAEDLARRNASNAADIVRYLPLVSAPSSASGQGNVWDGSGNNGYNIRGVEGNRVNLDVDGVPLPAAAPKTDGLALNSFGIGRDYIDPESFKDVHINSGSTSASRSGGLGSGVSFVTKSPDDFVNADKPLYLGYKFGYNSANSSKAHTATVAGQEGAFSALINFTRRDGKETENYDSDPAANRDDWRSNAILAKLNWRLTNEQRLDFAVDRYDRKNNRLIDSRVSATLPAGAQQKGETERTTYSIAHYFAPQNFSLFDTLKTRLYYQDASIEDQTSVSYPVAATPYHRDLLTGFYNKDTGITLDADKQLGNSDLRYGFGYSRNESERPWREIRTNLNTGAIITNNTGTKNRMADSDFDTAHAYGQYAHGFSLGGLKSTATAGLRVERVSFKPKNLDQYIIGVPNAKDEWQNETSTSVLPSFNLSVEVAPQLETYAQYKRGVRVPRPVEKTGTYDSFSYTGAGAGYAVLGNPGLKKETSDSFELGLKGQVANGVSLSAAAFHTRYKNFIEYVQQEQDLVNYPTVFLLYRPENIGRATIKGAEFTVGFDLGTWNQNLAGLSTTFAAGVSRGTATNTETGEKGKLASIAPAKASWILAYDAPSDLFGVSAAVVHVAGKQAKPDVIAGQDSATAERFKVPSYTTLDLFGYWNISKNATFNLGVHNVTDKKYWDYASVRGESATALANINRQSQPGRTYSASIGLKF